MSDKCMACGNKGIITNGHCSLCRLLSEQRETIIRLESALAAEREKVATLTDRVRGLEEVLSKIERDICDCGSIPSWLSRWVAEEVSAITPPAPAKAAREGESE